MTLSDMPTNTPEQRAAVVALAQQASALAQSRGYHGTQVTEIILTPDGALASIRVGQDADGMARYVLNFAL